MSEHHKDSVVKVSTWFISACADLTFKGPEQFLLSFFSSCSVFHKRRTTKSRKEAKKEMVQAKQLTLTLHVSLKIKACVTQNVILFVRLRFLFEALK